MTDSNKVPSDLRNWVESTAPLLTAKGWRQTTRLAGKSSGMSCIDGLVDDGLGSDEISAYQAKALLAYRDGVIAGITADAKYALVDIYDEGDTPTEPPEYLFQHKLIERQDEGFFITKWGRAILRDVCQVGTLPKTSQSPWK